MKSKSASRITRLRPQASARMEDSGEAIRARSEADDVMTDLSSEVSSLSERDVPIDTRVADMTPVSSLYQVSD